MKFKHLLKKDMTIVMDDLMETAKLARELALMGNYDSSGIYYEILLETLQKFMLNMNDPSKKGRWSIIQQQIMKEHTKLRELQKTLSGITMDLQSMPIQSKIQPSPYYASPSHYVDESPTKDFSWMGTKPQQHNDERWADPHIFGPPSGPPPSLATKNNSKIKNKVETNRKNTATRTTSNNRKNTSAPPDIKGKVGNTKPGSSASNRRANGNPGDKEKTDKEKAEETNEDEKDENQEEEKKFEASNHQVRRSISIYCLTILISSYYFRMWTL